MLMIFFTVVYFDMLLFVICRIFSHTLSPVTDVLSIICIIAAFIISLHLAEYTVDKIKEKYSNEK